tara:strand:- start:267 stop:518 length:252 start_codon:yes stop_codon:yes gene_type:complete
MAEFSTIFKAKSITTDLALTDVQEIMIINRGSGDLTITDASDSSMVYTMPGSTTAQFFTTFENHVDLNIDVETNSTSASVHWK